MAKPPSSEQLDALLPFDATRAAIDSIRGFDWQRWLTVEVWLGLRDEEALWIEWGEDLTIADACGVTTVQSKDIKGGISLGEKRTLAIVETALSRADQVTTVVWTRADPVVERGNDTGTPGIRLWQQASDDDVIALRSLLATRPTLSAPIRAMIRRSTDNEFRALLQKVRWVTGEEPIEELRLRVEAEVEERLQLLGLMAPALKRRAVAAHLFAIVASVGVQACPGDRRLTRLDLDKFVITQNALDFAASVPTFEKALADRHPLPVIGSAPSAEPPEPFTSQWFVFNERSTDLIGREAELAKLASFAEDDRPFLWWVLSGPAGVGKSRLAAEAMAKRTDGWESGFVAVKCLSSLAAALHYRRRNSFVTIDYAALDPATVRDLLRTCIGRSGSEAKVRILLLEREASPESALMQGLYPPLSPGNAELEQTLFHTPFEICPLISHQRELVRAWLEAAKRDPAVAMRGLTRTHWKQIEAMAGGRPLLLGMVAAALAGGRKTPADFASVGKVLEPVLRREIGFWKTVAPDPAERERLLALTVVGILVRGIPIPAEDSKRFALISLVSKRREEILLVEAEDGTRRLPTMQEILTRPDLSSYRGILQEVAERVVASLQTVVPPEIVSDTLVKLRQLIGPYWHLQPDLIAEYLIARRWSATDFTAGQARSVSAAPDATIERELGAAWAIAPDIVLFTLDQLRRVDFAQSASVRGLSALARVVASAGNADERLLDLTSHLIYNTLVGPPQRRPPQNVKEELLGALDHLSGAFDSEIVRYRLMKALTSAARRADPATRQARQRRVLEMFPSVERLARSKSKDRSELIILDTLRVEILQAVEKFDSTAFPSLISSLDHLAKTWGSRREIVNTCARLLFSISGSISDPGVSEQRTSALLREFRATHTEHLEASVRKFLHSGHKNLTEEGHRYVRWCLVNLSLAYLKLGRASDVERMYKWLVQEQGADVVTAAEGEFLINSLTNVVDSKLKDKEFLDALDYVKEAIALSKQNRIPEVRAGVVCIVREFATHALRSDQISLSQVAVDLLASAGWTTTEPFVIEILVDAADRIVTEAWFRSPAAVEAILMTVGGTSPRHSAREWAMLGLAAEYVAALPRDQACVVLRDTIAAAVQMGAESAVAKSFGKAVAAFIMRFGEPLPEEVTAVAPVRLLRRPDDRIDIYLGLPDSARGKPDVTIQCTPMEAVEGLRTDWYGRTEAIRPIKTGDAAKLKKRRKH